MNFRAVVRKRMTVFRQTALLLVPIAFLAVVPQIGHTQPEKGYDVISYDATVKLDRWSDSLWGSVTMTARATDSLPAILQHAKYIVVDSVIVSGAGSRVPIVSLDTSIGSYNLMPYTHIIPGQIFTTTTFYHGKGYPEQNQAKWGGVTNEDSMMFAMGVGFMVPYTSCTRHWLPCYDLPDDKPDSVDLTFICRDVDVTASNGLLQSNRASNGWRTMHWHISHPIATYLMMFATGPYTRQDIANPLGKPFEVFAKKRDSASASIAMSGRVSNVLAFYDSLFGHYPMEKVGYVLTPIGSMEHQTMICLDTVTLQPAALDSTSVSDNSTIAIHELSHMWWGDWVTCKTFDDAWLNEGFARFSESLALEHLFGRTAYLNRQHSNIAGAKGSLLPMSGAPTADKHTNNYPYSTIYQKGAAVLGMMRQYLGDSLFFDAVRYYGNVHAYSTATSADLESAFEHASGQDLSWFFKEWVYNYGYPKDTIVWSQLPSGAKITFKQARNTAAVPYFRMPIPVLGTTKSGMMKLATVWMDSIQTSMATADFGFTPDTLVIDPDGLLIMRLVRQTLGVSESQNQSTSSLRLQAYPNPDHAKALSVIVQSDRSFGAIHLSLYDPAGRLLRSLDTTSVSSSVQLSLDVYGLTAGAYTLVAQTESGERATQQITLNP